MSEARWHNVRQDSHGQLIEGGKSLPMAVKANVLQAHDHSDHY